MDNGLIMHHIPAMERALRQYRPSEAPKQIEPALGSKRHTRDLATAATAAVAEVVSARLDAGMPVFFSDSQGNLFVKNRDGSERKLTEAEIASYLS